NHTLIAIFSAYLAKAALEVGDYARACKLCHAALDIAMQIDRKTTIIFVFDLFSRLAFQVECLELSVQLHGFTLALREQLRLPISPHNQSEHDEHHQQLRSQSDAFERNMQIGRE